MNTDLMVDPAGKYSTIQGSAHLSMTPIKQRLSAAPILLPENSGKDV